MVKRSAVSCDNAVSMLWLGLGTENTCETRCPQYQIVFLATNMASLSRGLPKNIKCFCYRSPLQVTLVICSHLLLIRKIVCQDTSCTRDCQILFKLYNYIIVCLLYPLLVGPYRSSCCPLESMSLDARVFNPLLTVDM